VERETHEPDTAVPGGRLIDDLLERDEFADDWAMKWCDVRRVKAEFPINLWPNAAQAYHRWIRASIRDNVPYDRFGREMLTASRSNFRTPPVNFYRAVQGKEPEALAKAVALAFMGARAEAWPEHRLAGMAAFFARVGFKSTAEWKEETVLFDPGYGADEKQDATPPAADRPGRCACPWVSCPPSRSKSLRAYPNNPLASAGCGARCDGDSSAHLHRACRFKAGSPDPFAGRILSLTRK
jgi:hypothetical protein